MLKRIFKPLLATLLVWNVAVAQDEEVKTSKEFNLSMSAPYEVVDGDKGYFSNKDNVVSVKREGRKIFIQKFNSETGNQESIEMYEDFPAKYFILGAVEMKTKLYIVYFENMKGDAMSISAREVSYETGKFAGNAKQIALVTERISKGFWGGFSTENDGLHTNISESISLFVAYDKSHFLLQYRHVPEIKKDSENYDKIGMFVYDENLEKVWNQTVKMPYTEALMNNIAYTIDSEGTVHLLAEVFKEASRKKYDENGKPKFSYHLMSINGEGLEENKTEISLPGKFINQIKFFDGPNGELVLAGYYGNKYYSTDGMFAFQVNKQGEVLNQHYFEIPSDIMKLYVSERTQKKIDKKEDAGKDLSLSNMVLRQIQYLKDGSTVLVGEKYYVVTNYNPQTNTTTYTYYYEEIIAAKISANNEVQWMKKIPKKQIGNSGRGGMGYKYVFNNGKHYFFYLDNVKNLELAQIKYPAQHNDGRGGFLTAFQIDDASGDVQKLSLFDMRDVKGMKLKQFAVDRIVDVKENVMFVECYKGAKEDVMLKIEIND